MTINQWNILPLLIASGLLIASLVTVFLDASWEKYAYELAFVFGGFVAFVFSDTFSEFTSRYGWTREQVLQSPAWYVRIFGALALLICSNEILGII